MESANTTWRSPVSDLVVLAARRPLAVLVQSVLRDWNSLNLIDRVYVIDLDSLRDGDQQLPAIFVEGIRSRTCVLQEEITKRPVGLAQVGVLSSVGDVSECALASQATAVAEAIQSSLPSAQQVRAQIFVGAPDDGWGERVRPLFGWHNLAISPEDAASPSVGSAPLLRAGDDPRWITHVVGTLCSLFGLWRGQSEAVLPRMQPLPGEQLLPVRAYSRSLAAEAIEHDLQARLVSVGQRYPTPRVDTSTALVVEDEAGVAVGMADTLLDLYPEVRKRARQAPPRKKKEALDWKKALSLFWTFVWDAIRNAPARMASAMANEARRKVAAATSQLLFGGADGGFEVVVRGVKADGSLASWAEFETGLDGVITRAAPNAQLGVPPDTSRLWSDFVGAGMTLLDAGQRGTEMTPRFIGAQRAVISSTERVATHRDGDFSLPANLAAYLPGWRIEAADAIGASRLQRRLEELQRTNPNLAHHLSNEIHRLGQWRTQVGGSYVGRVGSRLAGEWQAVVDEIEALRAHVSALRASVSAADPTTDQASLGSRLRILTFAGFGVLTAFGFLTGMQKVTAWLGILLMLLTFVSWAVTGVIMFKRHQSRLFAMIHQMEQAASDLQTAEAHLAEAHEDLRRISHAYRQFLDWARAFGAFVHAPLGAAPASASRALHVGQGLPRAVGIGSAVANPETIDQISQQWRPQLFEAGWLQECWQEFLADVPSSLGDLRYPLVQDTSLLLKDQNLDGQGSVLARWSRAVADVAPVRATSERFLTKVGRLVSSDEASRANLLSTVQVEDAATGASTRKSRDEFLTGLDHDPGSSGSPLLGVIFAPHAINARAIGSSRFLQQSRGLTQATVLVQFGKGTSTSDFRRAGGPSSVESSSGDAGTNEGGGMTVPRV